MSTEGEVGDGMREPESKRAEQDHAIAAEVWNRLGLDDARAIGRWLNGAVQEIHWHRSRMTPEQLTEMERQFTPSDLPLPDGAFQALPDGVRRKR